MLKKISCVVGIFLILTTPSICFSEEYHFVSIERLIEQEIGRIIIPESLSESK